jgi:hypothetical protein
MTRSPGPKSAAQREREERLAAALRENLKRRKAQGRNRRAFQEKAPAARDDGDDAADS